MHITIQTRSRIPTGGFRQVLKANRQGVLFPRDELFRDIEIERIIAIRPISNLLPVQVNFSMTHRSIEYQCSFIGGSKRRCFKPETIPPNSDKRQSARTSGMLHGLFLPVLCYSHLLPVILNTERTINSPIVRYRYRLPTAVIIIQLTEIRMI